MFALPTETICHDLRDVMCAMAIIAPCPICTLIVTTAAKDKAFDVTTKSTLGLCKVLISSEHRYAKVLK
jgi:hypothetical protein